MPSAPTNNKSKSCTSVPDCEAPAVAGKGKSPAKVNETGGAAPAAAAAKGKK